MTEVRLGQPWIVKDDRGVFHVADVAGDQGQTMVKGRGGKKRVHNGTAAPGRQFAPEARDGLIDREHAIGEVVLKLIDPGGERTGTTLVFSSTEGDAFAQFPEA